MNKNGQMGEKKKRNTAKPVILPPLVAFNFPFPTVKMSEMNRQLQ